MNIKRIMAAALALLLALPAGGALASGQNGPIDRTIQKNVARTLDYLPEAAKERTDEIIIGVSDLLGETNPFWVKTKGDDYTASLLFDELLFCDNSGTIGDGAASFTASDNGETYTFTLQNGLRYADGENVTSDDFINALYLVLMPDFDGVYDIEMAGIQGVEAYLQGEASEISGIKRLSDKVFSITFKNANTNSLVYLTIPALRVSLFGDMRRPETLVQDQFFDFYQMTLASVRNTDATGMSYGQYTLVEHTPGEGATFAKNTDYWRGTPYISTITLMVIPIGEELDAILEGTVDIISVKASIETVDKAYDFETSFINLYTWTGDVFGSLNMDLESPLFSDVNVRRALAIGYNRKSEMNSTGSIERFGNLPSVLLFDGFSMSDSLLEELYPYDPELAAQLLDEAGWVLGEGGIRHKDGIDFSFTFYYSTPNPVMDEAVYRIAEDYRQLGLDMHIERVKFEELLTLVEENACDMYFLARQLPGSAALAANLFAGDSHLNQSGYASEMTQRYQKMIENEANPDRQSILYELLYWDLYYELPFIPLYRRMELLLVSARIMNVTVTSAHSLVADAYRFFLTDSLEAQW